MKKLYTKTLYVTFVTILVLGSFQTAKSQNWANVGSSNTPVGNSSLHSMIVYQGLLYAGCDEKRSQLRTWDGKAWKIVAGVSSKKNWQTCRINAMAIYKNKLYIAGDFDSVNNVAANCIACWNGTSWASVGRAFDSTVAGSFRHVECMKVSKDRLYVAGGFSHIVKNKPTNSIAYWDESTWSALDKVQTLPTFVVYCLEEYNNELYVGGGWFGKPGVSLVKYRDTIGFTPILNSDSYVETMGVFKGKLYFGGGFTHINDTVIANSIGVFDGKCSVVGLGAENKTISNHPGVWSMYSTVSHIYIGGQFQYMNGLSARGITSYDGKSFSVIDNGLKGDDHYIKTIYAYQNELYVGGSFAGIGNSNTVNIAKLDGLHLGIKLPRSQPKTEILYPNPVVDKLNINPTYKGKKYVFSSLGAVVWEGFDNEIDVSSLSAGLYYIQIIDNDVKNTYKFVKR